jgi:E3 ubiquitin-protein ligase RNF31
MIETVQTLATKYGREKGQENNQIGTISSTEAKDALRVHKGNVWAAVTECVEQRRKKVSFHPRQYN